MLSAGPWREEYGENQMETFGGEYLDQYGSRRAGEYFDARDRGAVSGDVSAIFGAARMGVSCGVVRFISLDGSFRLSDLCIRSYGQ